MCKIRRFKLKMDSGLEWRVHEQESGNLCETALSENVSNLSVVGVAASED
jgi:hypothetical protein